MTTSDTGLPELDGAPMFLLDDLPETDEILVDGTEGRHAVEVLRLAPGEHVRVGDGRGTVVDGEVTTERLHRGGTVARADGPLRAALDAALSSPSRRGVVVDDSGALVGSVRAHEVLTAIEEADRPELEDPERPGAPAA